MKNRFKFLMGASLFFVTAQGQLLPKFSVANDTTWYYVQFKNGSGTISDPGTGKKLITAQKSSQSNQMWALIGNQNDFVMKSKTGHYLSFSGGFYTSATQGEPMKLITSPNSNYPDSWELQRKNGTSSMNQWEGAGIGKYLGEYTAGDMNNPLHFVATTTQLPKFSTENNETWYFIKFCENGNTIQDEGIGKASVLAHPDPIDEQLWKLVGDENSFQLVNKAGHYAYVSGTDGSDAVRLKTQSEKWNGSFRLYTTDYAAYSPAWEIHVNGNKQRPALNQWMGAQTGNEIGLWQASDKNNPLYFIEPADMVYADYKVEGIEGYKPEHDLTLWYTQPTTLTSAADKWMEYSLPIGNGQFGASIFGGVLKEEVQFNEKTLWSGTNKDNGSEYGDYENFGSVYIESLGEEGFSYGDAHPVQDYYRQLDLTNATASVVYKSPDKSVTYTREYIASNPDQVVAMRLKASEPGKLSLRFTMESGKPGIKADTEYKNGYACFKGKLQTVSYNARLKVIPTGGHIETTDEGITVKAADEILVILGGGTDFDAYAPNYVSATSELEAKVLQKVDAAAQKGWEQLYEDHVADYGSLFGRVHLNLEGAKNNLPTDELIKKYAQRSTGTEDYALMLEALYFNYGRYLMLGSSRGVDLPSNLQGIWNNSSEPAWNGDIHANINVQMNYWPAEITNLSELHLPFINYITNMAMNHDEWKGYARDAGQTKGWTCYTENNIFGGVGSFMHNYVITNAWYCTHLWQHYRYTLDKEYLAKVFPTMWSASEFWLERLIKDSDGLYVCPQEFSPEHGPTEDGVAHAQQLVWDLLANTQKAAQILGTESGLNEEQLALLSDRLKKLDKGLRIEKYTGAWGATLNGVKTGDPLLREWKESTYDAGQNGHRHMSHLMCIYPFSQVTATSPYFEAALNSLKLRGDASTGWSMGWKINLWARMQDGNHAHDILELALRHHSVAGGGIYYNLYDAHAPFQIDGNFGACAGIAEMLMQSHTDTIQILPALPEVWKNGSIEGLKAVGDFTVDVSWKELKPQTVHIVSNQGSPLYVSYPGIATATVYVNGKETQAEWNDMNTLHIDAQKGDQIEIDCSKIVTQIAQITDSPNFSLDVQDNKVTVKGTEVQKVTVYDVEGKILLTTSNSCFALNHDASQMYLIQVTDKQGNTNARKLVLP